MEKMYKRQTIGLVVGLLISFILMGVLLFLLQETREQLQMAREELLKTNNQILDIGKQADQSRAGELAGLSQLLDINDGTKMIQSGLLAVESAKYGASLQADQALRRYLNLAALPVSKVSHGINANVRVAFSPDGKYLATGGLHSVIISEAQSGHVISTMLFYSTSSVAFSPDGKYVAAGGWDGTARVWEVHGGRDIISQIFGKWVAAVAFSPDGRFVAWSGEDTIRIWDIKKTQEVMQIPHRSVSFITFSPDGRYLLSSGRDGTARVWDVKSGTEIVNLDPNGQVRKAVFSSDGKYIATISEKKAVIWEMKSGREISRMYHEDTVNDIALSPDGRYAISGSTDKTARVWETLSGDEVARMIHNSFVYSVAFSPDGKYVLSGSDDGTARLWFFWDGHEIARFEDASINSAIFSPDGKYVATSGCEIFFYNHGRICQSDARIWEVSNGRHVIDIPQRNSLYDFGHINTVMYDPINENHVLTGNDDAARIWDLRSGQEIFRMRHGQHNSVFARYSPNGQYILTMGGDAVVRVWNAKDGYEIAYMKHENQVMSFDISPDSKYVVSGDSDGELIIWEAKRGREISRMSQNGPVRNLVFSSNGKYIASIDPGKFVNNKMQKEGIVRIWDALSGREVKHIDYPFQIDTITFSPDSQLIVFSSFTDPTKPNHKGIVSIRNITMGNEVGLYTHPYRIYSMLFTPDGKKLITASSDGLGTIVLWDIGVQKAVAKILTEDPMWGYHSLAVTSDNRYLLTGGWPNKIWDIQSIKSQVETTYEWIDNQNFITYTGKSNSKNEISRINHDQSGLMLFSADGRFVLTTGCDANYYGFCNEQHIFIVYWRIEDLAAEACRRLPRNFTLAEWVQYFPDEEYRATCPNLPLEPESTPGP